MGGSEDHFLSCIVVCEEMPKAYFRLRRAYHPSEMNASGNAKCGVGAL